MDELCVTEMNSCFITSDDIRMECGKSKASPKNGMDATGTGELDLRLIQRPAVSLTTADLQLQGRTSLNLIHLPLEVIAQPHCVFNSLARVEPIDD